VAYGKATLITGIKALCDAGSQLLKIALGSVAYEDYPDPDDSALGADFEYLGKTRTQMGQGWNSPSLWEQVLEYLGTYLDRNDSVWARINTQGTGVAPTILNNWGVSAVTKNEAGDYLDLTLSPGYSDAYGVFTASTLSVVSIPVFSSITATTLRVKFYDYDGVVIAINSQDVMISGCGKL